MIKEFLRQKIKEDSFLRLSYSWGKSFLANVFFKNYSKDLVVIGVTGTDGKTSTTYFIAQILEQLGQKVALASTEFLWIDQDKQENKTKRTTLSPFFLRKFLKKAKQKNCKYVVLEVSSHALSQGRIWGIEFDKVLLTNLSQEHTNYHKTYLEYAKTKAKLLKYLKKSKKLNKNIFVYNQIDFKKEFLKVAPSLTKTYALKDKTADLSVLDYKNQEKGYFFSFKDENFFTNLQGDYNLENLLGSILIINSLGFSLKDLKKPIENLKLVPGRLEEIKNNQGFRVFVDFALTPRALENLLKYGQKITKNQVWIVFGATGANHDKKKRPLMGQVVSQYADKIVLTEDENYGEDNQKIMADVSEGIKEKSKLIKINDRKEAIFYALNNAKTGDIVFVTGMGNFTTRNLNLKEVPWSDREIIQSFFNQKNK